MSTGTVTPLKYSPGYRLHRTCRVLGILEPLSEKLPGFRLHLSIELVRRVVQPADLVAGRAGLFIALTDLLICRLEPFLVEERVPGTVDKQDRAWGDQGRYVRQIQIAEKSHQM